MPRLRPAYDEFWHPRYNEKQITVRSVAGCPGDEGVFVRYADGLLVFLDMALFIDDARERRFLPERSRLATTRQHVLFESEGGEREAVCSALIRSFYDHHVEFQFNTRDRNLGIEWGDRIFRARIHRRMTQKELAEAAGMLQSAISRLETGRHVPRPETIDRIADALRMAPFEIAAISPRQLPPPFWGRVGPVRGPR